MNKERTLSIIKPNAIIKNVIGKIINRLELNGFAIIASKMVRLTVEQSENFYFEHREKVFFRSLIDFITSGPLIVQVLEGEDIILRYRKIMGDTNPKYALPGTLRADYADGLIENAVHGSDSKESALREISFFFSTMELYPRFFII